MPSKLAQEIRNARHAAGLTQRQLGLRLGLKGRAVYRWERDDSAPTKRHQRAVVLAIQAVNPQAANTLAVAFASLGKGPSALNANAPGSNGVAPATQLAVDPAAALERAIYRAADDLNVPARHVRAVLARLFVSLAQANLTLDDAARCLEQIVEQSRERNLPP